MKTPFLSKEDLPAQFTKEEIEEFKTLFFKNFHVQLNDEEAFDKANRLFRAVKASAKPISEDDKIKE